MSDWTKTRHPGIFARDGLHGRRYKVMYRDNAGTQHGKQVGSLAEALAFQGKVRGGGVPAENVAARAATVDSTFEAFLAEKIRRKGSRRRGNELSPSTVAGYRSVWSCHVSPVMGSTRIAKVTRRDVTRLLAGVTPIRRGTNPSSTTAHVYRVMTSVFNWAVWDERIPANPVALVDFVEDKGREPRILEAGEVDRLADAIEPRFAALVRLAAWTGPRFGELSFLRVRHLDYLRRRIHIEGSASYVRGHRHEGPTKTGTTRTVSVPREVWDDVVAHVVAYGNPKDPDSYVFTMAAGGPLNLGNFRKRDWADAVEAAGITPAPRGPHDLRHTAASLMGRSGYSLAQAGAMLGHSTVYMTDHYSHLYADDLDVATGKLDAAIAQARKAGQSPAL